MIKTVRLPSSPEQQHDEKVMHAHLMKIFSSPGMNAMHSACMSMLWERSPQSEEEEAMARMVEVCNMSIDILHATAEALRLCRIDDVFDTRGLLDSAEKFTITTRKEFDGKAWDVNVEVLKHLWAYVLARLQLTWAHEPEDERHCKPTPRITMDFHNVVVNFMTKRARITSGQMGTRYFTPYLVPVIQSCTDKNPLGFICCVELKPPPHDASIAKLQYETRELMYQLHDIIGDHFIEISGVKPKATITACSVCRCIPKEGDRPFSSCGLCKGVRYCSKKCQRADWKTHKLFCSGLKDRRQELKAHKAVLKCSRASGKLKDDSDSGDEV